MPKRTDKLLAIMQDKKFGYLKARLENRAVYVAKA
jgi:hypothetical protein